MTKPQKIVFVHSLNNFTGSPNVLATVIRGFLDRGYRADLITSNTEGFLSGIPGVNVHHTCYRWDGRKAVTALLMMISNIQVFFRILFARNDGVLYYINTITPVGAAWACRLTNKRYIYHVHEDMSLPKPVYGIFRWTYRHCNRYSVFVSHYLKSTASNCKNGIVVHNALDKSFVQKAEEALKTGRKTRETILMVASLRRFKGIYEFAELANRLPNFSFELVLAADPEQVQSFTNEVKPSDNLTVYPSQENVHPFYRRTKILIQLSHPDVSVETFGMTILEALVYGVPAIVPNVGGPAEIIEDGVNGFHIHPHDLESVACKIELLMEEEDLYQKFSESSRNKADSFSQEKMISSINRYICEKI